MQDVPNFQQSSRWRGRLMYQPHPDKHTLFSNIPANLVEATQNIRPIHFDDLQEMHQLVWDLAEFVADWQPDLIPFFATGGIPYLFPMMDALRKTDRLAPIDGQHLHLYPGLAWGGTINGMNSEDFFSSSFGEIIRSRLASEPVRILVIDTTNSGNAVNKAVSALQKAIEASGASTDTVAMKVIGIVNTNHAESQHSLPEKSLVTGHTRTASVFTPSGFRCSSSLCDRQFTHVTPVVDGVGISFEVTYWLAGNIPTEDKVELIGVEAVHETLTTRSKARAGRLKIVYNNGETQQGTGIGHLPGRLISLLSLPLDAWQWDKMRTINQLPPLTDEEMEELAEIKEMSDGGIRLFELMSMDQDDAVDGLIRISRLLTDVEVYWLRTIDPPPRVIASKVCASLARDNCTASEALKYFHNAFPDLATSDPGEDATAWWIKTIRSLPKEEPLDEDSRLAAPEMSDKDSNDLDARDAGDDDDLADLALDFVVIVGGIEEARKLLSEQMVKEMSLRDIEKHLDETWPVTADKAIRFQGPTNEQVTLNFVLECEGWEEAHACLEDWIVKHSIGSP